MRVLWLSLTPGAYYQCEGSLMTYGGGWIVSLQKALTCETDVQVALSFVSHDSADEKKIKDGVTYYPLYSRQKGWLRKLRYYYGGYKHLNAQYDIKDIKRIIADFNPDIIHLFGLECPMASVLLEQLTLPIVVHLQGLLVPYNNAFFPPGINKTSFLWPLSVREWIKRNGYVYAKNVMAVNAQRECKLWKHVHYAMGRTQWDKDVSGLLAPDRLYYHVDEVLRDSFYAKAGSWQRHNSGCFVIMSTISEPAYKGLDLILKTACELRKTGAFDFKWLVVGIKSNFNIVKFYESVLGIKSNDVGVVYAGMQNEVTLADMLLGSDVYVHPSYIDNSPNSLCEAQLLGCPVVGTYVGGIPTLINHNDTGLLVAANDPYVLAMQIIRLHDDADLSVRLGHNAHVSALARHDRRAVCHQLQQTYQQVCEHYSQTVK